MTYIGNQIEDEALPLEYVWSTKYISRLKDHCNVGIDDLQASIDEN